MYRLNLLMVLVGTTVAFLVVPARPNLFEDDSEELHRLGSTSTLGGRRHFDQFGQHDDEFDHEAVLGAHDEVEAFKELEPEEAKARLAVLVDKMDSNNNSFVEKTELRDWIISSFRFSFHT
ncbi:unnamed protein product [Protopolystoma xenopodis]|uniref:EF-hand domain-containing protein n=1 Tax=Protopolystoma xenopodis TaxID=117903 RepID=A0A448XC22_9PLAT|nr:unnamed protein product [Protopolystoma xenopodis]